MEPSRLVEIYILLLFDKISGTFLLPIHWPYVFEAMLYIGGFNKLYMSITAIVGSCIGAVGDWYIGKACTYLKKGGSAAMFETEKIKLLVQSIMFAGLILAAATTPTGGLLIAISGLAAMRCRTVIILVAISNVAHISYAIFRN